VAKTVRDGLMRRLAVRYPGYGWQTNVGYGTRDHQTGLAERGATRHHRLSFAPVAQLPLLEPSAPSAQIPPFETLSGG